MVRFSLLLPVLLSSVHSVAEAADGPVLHSGTVPLPEGGQLAYHVRAGSGPVLVLIPGSWGDRHVFDATLNHLDDTLHVVIVEMRGHGGSWPPLLSGSIELLAEDVLRVTDALGLDRFFVGGHSIGGMIAVDLAGRRPAVIAGAVSIEGWTHHEVQRNAFGHITGTTRTPAEEAERQAARTRGLSRLTDEQRRVFASFWRRWNGQPILEATNVPILELWGDRGHPVPARDVMRIPERDTIQLKWIAGASHSLLIECPRDVAESISQFVDDISRQTEIPTDPAHMCGVPGINAEAGELDFNGLPDVPHDVVTIFRGVEHDAGFNMHPYITHYNGLFWAMWSCNHIRDLQAGQHVRYAVSRDGTEWSPARQLMAREDEAGRRYFARGFWVRDGQLIALAARDEAVRPLFGPGLELRGYVWDDESEQWGQPMVVSDDTINNFPPRRLPSGEWMMSRRDHRMRKSMLTGGTASANEWTSHPVPIPDDGARLDEPFWWQLPDGRLSGVFRDGSKSRRLYRSFSRDNGRTWETPVRTDFPDAMAKFNVLRLNDGRYVMVSNPNVSGVRIPLVLSVSKDGVIFDRMLILRDQDTIYRYAGKSPGYAGYHYPQLLEHKEHLYVIHSENMEDIRLLRIRLSDLAEESS